MLLMRSIIRTIKKNEDLRLKPYHCTANKLSIGYGRNLDDQGITESEAEAMLLNDIGHSIDDLFKIFPAFSEFTYNRTMALIDMMYNLGCSRFSKFKRMIAAIKKNDWEEAAKEAKDSRWYYQVGNRAVKNVELLRGG